LEGKERAKALLHRTFQSLLYIFLEANPEVELSESLRLHEQLLAPEFVPLLSDGESQFEASRTSGRAARMKRKLEMLYALIKASLKSVKCGTPFVCELPFFLKTLAVIFESDEDILDSKALTVKFRVAKSW